MPQLKGGMMGLSDSDEKTEAKTTEKIQCIYQFVHKTVYIRTMQGDTFEGRLMTIYDSGVLLKDEERRDGGEYKFFQ